MEKYVIKGGNVLEGEVSIAGAKNAALGILAAAVMTDEECIIENVPYVEDTKTLLRAIETIGAKVKYIDNHTVSICGGTIRTGEDVCVDDEYIRKIRASYYLLGALLGKYNYAQVALPGGCDIGLRPIDQHIKGFKALGADVSVNYGMVTMEDLLETIVGNIQDEYDKEENEYQKLSDTEYTIDGWISVDEVEDLLGIKIPDDTEYDTLGGVVVDMLGDLPEEGQHPSVQIDRVRFTVLEVDDRRISRLKAEILPDESYPEPGERRD